MRKGVIKAFTVMEMLINMLISSIIIGMVYFTYISYTKQLSFFLSDVKEKNHLNQFLFQLKSDFYNAERVLSKPESFQVVLYNTRTINYSVFENHLIREQNGNEDSLRIKSINFKTFKNPETYEEYIKWASINTYLFDEPLEFTVFKNYPTIVELETNNGD